MVDILKIYQSDVKSQLEEIVLFLQRKNHPYQNLWRQLMNSFGYIQIDEY